MKFNIEILSKLEDIFSFFEFSNNISSNKNQKKINDKNDENKGEKARNTVIIAMMCK